MIAALRQEVERLKASNASLVRERDEAQASAKSNEAGVWAGITHKQEETIRSLEKQIATYTAAVGETGKLKDVAKLSNEVETLKEKLAKAEAKTSDDRVVELEKKLKAANTRAANERLSARIAWDRANASPATITKSDHRKLDKVFHPDSGKHATEAQLNEASQIWNALKVKVHPDA